MQIDGSGRVHLVQSMPVLRPDEQVLQSMLDGWRNQQLSRNLQFATIEQRLRCVQRFIDHVNEDPSKWTPATVEEFSADLRAVKDVAHSTLRGYHSALRAFTTYISNPDYGWDQVCEQYFGTHPAQVFFDWNTAPHVQAYDGRPTKRPYTREELDALFEHADNEVARIGSSGKMGWQPAYRDAVMMKIAYGYGLRFNELRHLQTVDFARNPHAREFGSGVCKVRYGKSRRSSPYKGRSVLTAWRWTPGILEDWLANGRGDPGTLDLFPSERGGLVSESTLLRRLRRYCDELGFPDGLDIHSFRRSYATQLLEAGWDPRFVQDQMGHEYAATTGIYQFTCDEFRRSTLRAALVRAVGEALGAATRTEDDEAQSRLHLAVGRADGRARTAQHHRPHPTAGRTRHHSLAPAGLPAGQPATRTGLAPGRRRDLRHLRLRP